MRLEELEHEVYCKTHPSAKLRARRKNLWRRKFNAEEVVLSFFAITTSFLLI